VRAAAIHVAFALSIAPPTGAWADSGPEIETGSVRRGVLTAPVRRERLPRDLSVTAPVTYDVDHYSAVSPKANGVVGYVRARVGDPVVTGDVLAELQGTGPPIRAPIKGLVVSRSVETGQYVTRATRAFAVADLDCLWSYVSINAQDLPAVWLGQRIKVMTDAIPNHSFPGSVTRIDEPADPKGPRLVRVEIANPAHTLRVGALVTITLLGDLTRYAIEALAVPATALVGVADRRLVLVRGADGYFSERPITTGATGGDLVEVTSGLAEGESVALGASAIHRSGLVRH
jgi:multidrug efflux pump subunit AcrA (membrane-fusion protein)